MALLLIGFVGGLLTGISPCILPVLPVVFIGGVSPGEKPGSARSRRRPLLVVGGLTLSFAVFTLFGTLVLSLLHLPAGLIRWLGLIVLVLVGLTMIFPPLEQLVERPFRRIPQKHVRSDRSSFVFGLALGAVFVPCAGPVLAAIAVAGATGRIGPGTLALTAAFAVGTAIPLLFFALSGQQLYRRLRALRKRQRAVRTVSGAVMIALAVALTFNLADAVQQAIPDYTQKVGNSLEHGASQASSASSGASAALQACENTADYDGAARGDCGQAPPFTKITQWFNTPNDQPLTLAGLKGDVVLVDFWAYSCINCQRELPHVEAWSKAYASDGFVAVGVQTPEYSFEHVPANVKAGAERLGLTFPVAIDDSYGTWDAYANQSWPAGYLIDATGTIRYVTVGEGDYAQEESYIRQLLMQAHPGVSLAAPTNVPNLTPNDPEQSPETYLGSEREQYYGGDGSYAAGTHQYALPAALAPNTFALAGTWTVAQQSITAGSGARIRLDYHASLVYLDVGGGGTLTVTGAGATQVLKVSGAPNIYTVVSTPTAQSGVVTIQVSGGLQAYSFTFG